MEDLEFNAFYRALQSQYQALYDRAQDECWLVCVPCSSSLPHKSQITYSFAEAHLLEPSKMLRDEYNALVGGKRIHWKIVNNKLICSDRNAEIDIIAEELAYNKKYSQYKMFIIKSPLIEGGSHQAKKGNKGLSKEDLLIPRRTNTDHLQLLQCFHKHEEILSELNKRLLMFNKSYMILEDFLMDASKRLETLLKNGYSSYVVEHSTDERVQDRRVQEAVWLAVESQIMNSVHSKVYPMTCSKFIKEDKQFNERCRQLRSSFSPSALSLPSDYHCPYPLTLSDLRKLQRCELPLEKLYCLQDVMDSIYKDVSGHFKSRLRLGDPSMLQSDDLIPLLATILVQANLKLFVSDVNYVEMFHWSPSDSNKLSYVLVTIRASLEYIRGQDVKKYLTKPKSLPPSRAMSVSSSLSSSRTSFSNSPLFELYNQRQEDNEINHTLSKLTKLKLQADQIEDQPVTDESNESLFGSHGDKVMH